jgi:hypothetical protein
MQIHKSLIGLISWLSFLLSENNIKRHYLKVTKLNIKSHVSQNINIYIKLAIN